MMQPNNQWPGLGVSDEELEAQAMWLSRDDPAFRGAISLYFESAGKLLRLTRYEFFLLPFVFVQAVIGLEKLLRLHYKDPDGKLKLAEMLSKAVTDGVTTDEVFSDIAPLKAIHLDGLDFLTSRAVTLASLIPQIRNDIVHGNYILTPKFLPLTLQVRRIADAVAGAIKSKGGVGARL